MGAGEMTACSLVPNNNIRAHGDGKRGGLKTGVLCICVCDFPLYLHTFLLCLFTSYMRISSLDPHSSGPETLRENGLYPPVLGVGCHGLGSRLGYWGPEWGLS